MTKKSIDRNYIDYKARDCEACEMENEKIKPLQLQYAKHTCGKETNYEKGIEDGYAKGIEDGYAIGKRLYKPEALPSWEEEFDELYIGSSRIRIKDFIRQTIKTERAEAVKEYSKIIFGGATYEEFKKRIKEQAVKEFIDSDAGNVFKT